jgi:hypothetical protein
MEIMGVFFLAQGLPSIGELPAPGGVSWWPYVAWSIMALISIVSAGFAAWMKLSEKRLDIEREAEAKKLGLEVESLKLDFEQRKNFTDRIIAECERAKLDEAKSKEEVWRVLAIVNERDKTIREQHDLIFELKAKVSKMEIEIDRLKHSMGLLQKSTNDSSV